MNDADMIKAYMKTYEGQICQWRRQFHEYPETSFQERRTTLRIVNILEDMGIPCEVNPEQHTGVVAKIEGDHPGKAVALRADIDALPVQEATGAPFTSRCDGCMHACGHDGHIAALLGAARMLVNMKDRLYGTVYLIFQPGEETGRGAPYMIRFGNWYEEIGSIFGGHLWIDVPSGKVSVEKGERMAAADEFTILVHGRAGHGSQPQQTVDAAVVASAIVLNLQSLVSRHVSPLDSVVLTIGTMQSGTRFNIISGEAELCGTTRYFKKDMAEDIKATMERIIQHTAAAYGASAELQYRVMVPPVVNEGGCSAIAEEAVRKILGGDAVTTLEKTTGGEDFAYYLEKKPGCFALIGIYNPDAGAVHSHHSDAFTIDESALPGAAGIYAMYAVDWLRLHS